MPLRKPACPSFNRIHIFFPTETFPHTLIKGTSAGTPTPEFPPGNSVTQNQECVARSVFQTFLLTSETWLNLLSGLCLLVLILNKTRLPNMWE